MRQSITIIYKTFIGGAHARTNITCLVFSSIYYIIPSVIARYANLPNSILLVISALIFIFSLYVIIKHAPADTEEVPILNKIKRKKYKVFSIISLILMYVISYILNFNSEISKVIIFTILLTDIFACNIAYKLFKCKHSYESDEFKECFTK